MTGQGRHVGGPLSADEAEARAILARMTDEEIEAVLLWSMLRPYQRQALIRFGLRVLNGVPAPVARRRLNAEIAAELWRQIGRMQS